MNYFKGIKPEDKVITTRYIPYQEYYPLPQGYLKNIEIKVYNTKDKKWRKLGYHLSLTLDGNLRSTDETIKLILKPEYYERN